MWSFDDSCVQFGVAFDNRVVMCAFCQIRVQVPGDKAPILMSFVQMALQGAAAQEPHRFDSFLVICDCYDWNGRFVVGVEDNAGGIALCYEVSLLGGNRHRLIQIPADDFEVLHFHGGEGDGLAFDEVC